MQLDRPILITGTPRCGKSILRRILSASSEFHCVDEPLLVWSAGVTRRGDDTLTAEDATPPVCERIRRDCAAMVAKAGCERYLDNLSHHALRIPFVRKVMPEARIIHMVRGPDDILPELLFGWTYRDSVKKAMSRRWRMLRLRGLPSAAWRFVRNYVGSRTAGRRSTWGPTPPGLHEFARSHDAAQIAAFQWARMVEIAIDDLAACPPGSWMQVRFEEMVAKPEETLRKVIAFIEPADPQAITSRAAQTLDPNFVFERKVPLTEAQWSAIEGLLAPVRARLRIEGPAAALLSGDRI